MASRRFRFGYLVSGQGRLLQTVINARELSLPFDIGLVIASSNNGAVEKAQRAGIPFVVIEPKTFASRALFDEAVAGELSRHGIDGIMMAFDYLIGPALLKRWHDRILNVHFSLLPLFPGFHPIPKAAASGMRFAGVSLHLADETMDGGAIVQQAVVPVDAGLDAQALGARLFRAAVPAHLQSMCWLAEDRLLRDAQGRLFVKDSRYEPGPYSPNLEPPVEGLPGYIYAIA